MTNCSLINAICATGPPQANNPNRQRKNQNKRSGEYLGTCELSWNSSIPGLSLLVETSFIAPRSTFSSVTTGVGGLAIGCTFVSTISSVVPEEVLGMMDDGQYYYRVP